MGLIDGMSILIKEMFSAVRYNLNDSPLTHWFVGLVITLTVGNTVCETEKEIRWNHIAIIHHLIISCPIISDGKWGDSMCHIKCVFSIKCARLAPVW